MSPLSEKLRELAGRLRKQAADLKLPQPTTNPVASRSKGDLGSLGNLGPKATKPAGTVLGGSNA